MVRRQNNQGTNEMNEMLPMSGETVETDGLYIDEAGREVTLKRGDTFPADLTLGKTEYKLVEFDYNNHHQGLTDSRLYTYKGHTSNTGPATPLQRTDGDTPNS